MADLREMEEAIWWGHVCPCFVHVCDDGVHRIADVQLPGRCNKRDDVHDLGHEQLALHSIPCRVADDKNETD